MCDSISLISYAGCLGLSPVILAKKLPHKCVSQPEIAENSLKTHYIFISKSFKVIDVGTPESSSAVLVMISSKYVSICNRSLARLVDSSRNHAF